MHGISINLAFFYMYFADFRLQFLSAIGGASNSPLNGMFIDSCYLHCQTEMQETWLMPDSPLLSKTVTQIKNKFMGYLFCFEETLILINFV